ncbi:MAG TPA: DNA recombination/repair protein RecA, partial [Anaerolineae bacterium]|nr:DNA recombination/repair protein RecA [Anaerolineae bacterium]
RLMSQALRKLAGAISRSQCSVIFTNQLRQKIGVMFGNPETTTGGMALKFYASVRMDIRRTEAIKNGQEVIGNRTRIRIKKNKVAAPFREAEFDILYLEGISRFGDVLDMGVQHGIVEKRGSFFFYEEARLAQGRENAKQALKDNADLTLEIENKVRAILGVPPRPVPVPVTA